MLTGDLVDTVLNLITFVFMAAMIALAMR